MGEAAPAEIDVALDDGSETLIVVPEQ
jgi:hypothetical protein